jgi:hypothetical protein
MNSIIIGISVLLVAGFLCALHLGGFLFTEVVLFSSVQGIVKNADIPLPGVLVKRQVDFSFGGELIEDISKTDENGKFQFGPVRRMLWLNLPHEPMVRQDIYIDQPDLADIYGREFKIKPSERRKVINLWMYTKRDYDLDSEFAKIQNRALNCDLKNELGKLYPSDPQTPWRESPVGICRIE